MTQMPTDKWQKWTAYTRYGAFFSIVPPHEDDAIEEAVCARSAELTVAARVLFPVPVDAEGACLN